MQGKSSLQIICNNRRNKQKHISDSLGKTKSKHLHNYWVSKKIKYCLKYICSNYIVKLNKKCQMSVMLIYYFFLTSIWLANFGHYWGDSLTNPMLITAFLLFWPDGHHVPHRLTSNYLFRKLNSCNSQKTWKIGSFDL